MKCFRLFLCIAKEEDEEAVDKEEEEKDEEVNDACWNDKSASSFAVSIIPVCSSSILFKKETQPSFW